MIYGQPITFSGGGAPKLFGDGSDGVGLFTADTTWEAETEDTGMIVKNFESLTISEGVTVSAGNRNCGMIVRVKGDCTIAGSLVNKMSPKTILDSDGVDFSIYPASMLNGTAGNGGDGGTCNSTTDSYGLTYKGASGGSGMTGRFYGGGWSGGGASGIAYRNSGNGYGAGSRAGGSSAGITTAVSNIFVGSTNAGQYGGGGGWYYSSYTGYNGTGGNGAGGAGTTLGGGAGNYGGGVIILLVGGNLIITGTIDCSGSNGGAGGDASKVPSDLTVKYGGLGGGGGGGGRIFICHKGTISNNGTLNVNGGAAGADGDGGSYPTGGNYGTNGSAGIAGSIGTTAVKTYKQYKKEDVA